jgi:hypothetical protein
MTSCAIRRIRNEMKQWDKNFNTNNRYMTFSEDTSTVYIYFMDIGNIKDIIFEINCYMSEYPFKPPKITYSLKNKKHEIVEIYKLSQNEREELKLINSKMTCLCCYSFLCTDNWHVGLKMYDIAKEIEGFLILRDRIKKRKLMRKVQIKEEKIPNDIWNEIITYL